MEALLYEHTTIRPSGAICRRITPGREQTAGSGVCERGLSGNQHLLGEGIGRCSASALAALLRKSRLSTDGLAADGKQIRLPVCS